MMYMANAFIFPEYISQPGWMKLDPGSSNSFDLHSKYKSIHVRIFLEFEHGSRSLDYQSMT